jgi:kynureninase
MDFKNTYGFAEDLDNTDALKRFRDEFYFPQHLGENKIYFAGNSLGLQPKKGKDALLQELDDWAEFGVDGHFEAKNPWYSYHEFFKKGLAEVVGAKEIEVTPMGGLTANLHFLMVSFYQPKGKRIKILCEGKAFPSDQYALETQVKFHGFTSSEAIVELFPRDGEVGIREEDILTKIKELGDELALIMIGGVNYYTGQVFPMKEITKAGHDVGAIVGFDLAHAAGNVKLNLHDWGVDFAAWCSYKYLNAGPGSVAGIYVHERHSENNDLNRFAGWWGTPSEDRFQMEKGFIPAEGADAWQLSNAPVLSMAVHKVALDLHLQAGVENLVEKQKQLTSYLEFVLRDISERISSVNFTIITPKERGSQLSILTEGKGKELFNKMAENGVMADWREPNVIRVAPVPMYNSFRDVFYFGQIIEKSIDELN